MGARHKLNQAFVNGALIVAGLIGFATQSLIAFLVVLGILLLLSTHSGDIRPDQRNRRRK